MLMRSLSGAALALLLSGCTFIIQPILAEAEARLGEGSGGEGEGEGEGGEGEGEGENDDDPACEAQERLIVVRDDEVDVVRIYALNDGGLRRRFPDRVDVNVNLNNDDPNASSNGYGGTHAVVGTEDRLYVVGDRFLYQLRASTLNQQTIGGRPMVTLDAFSSYRGVEMLNDVIVLVGPDIATLPQSPAVGETAVTLHDGDDYLSSTSFSIGPDRYVAVSAEYGYVVVASFAGGPPEVVANVDVESDTARIHKFFGTPKGIAFDPATQQLLLGDHARVITLKAPNFIYDPTDDSGDFVLAGGGEIDVAAIAARGGFAWVMLRRGTNNLIKLDLSRSPPVAVALTTVENGGFGRDISLGCRRVFLTSQNKVTAVDKDDLGAAGNLAINDVQRIRVVSRRALGLEGDD